MEAEGGFVMPNGQNSQEDGPPASMNPVSCENFSKVIFPNIKKNYAPKTDIKCQIYIKEKFQSGPKDWVGIFKVGWQTPKEYYTWVFASSSVENDVLFKAYYLPKDDDFYQFCYVDQTGEVRGVSTPFQFAEDESEIVIVPTQEEIDQVNEENRKLKETNQDMAKEIQTLKDQLNSATEKNSLQKENLEIKGVLDERIQTLEAQLHTATEKNTTLEMENMDLRTQVKMFEDENEMLHKNILEPELIRNELLDVQTELQQKTMALERIMAENKQLQSENKAKQQAVENLTGLLDNCKKEVTIQKDELEGQKKSLEMEKRQKEELHCTLEGEKRKLQDLESNFKKISTMSRNAEENISMLKQQMALQQKETADKNEEIKKLHSDIAHLEANENKLKTNCKEYLQKIEDIKKLNDNLEESLKRKRTKLLDSENKVREFETALRSAQENCTSMKYTLTMEQNESGRNRDLIAAMKSAIELKEEEIADLRESCERKQAEVDDLNSKRLQAYYGTQTLPSFSSSSQAQGLIYGNPYEENPSRVSTKNESHERFGAILDEEKMQTMISQTCPICLKRFQGVDAQVFEDHVLCHTIED